MLAPISQTPKWRRTSKPKGSRMARKKKDVSEAQVRIIREMYDDGTGMLRISKKVGHNVGVIRRVLTEAGYEIRPVGRPIENK